MIETEILLRDSFVISYRPEFAKHLGSVTAAILLQQILFRWRSNGREPFYKFKQPCSHSKYREGDSWCEELCFTRYEFDSALKLIAQKLKKGSTKDPDAIVYYWTNIHRETMYEINIDAFHKATIQIYGKGDTDNTEVGETDLDINKDNNKDQHTDNSLSPVENPKKSDHRNQDGTLDVNGFLNSVKSESEPKEAPPVAPPPPEMDEFEMQDEAVRILTQKATLSRERYEIQQMKAKHKRTFEEMQEEAGRFAAWYVTNMIEADESDFAKILNKAKTLTRAQVQTIYTSKFWSRKYGSPQNRNQNGTATPKKSNYIRPSDLARLYPEFYPTESGGGTPAANGNNSDPEQEFEIVSEPDGGIFAKHPFA